MHYEDLLKEELRSHVKLEDVEALVPTTRYFHALLEMSNGWMRKSNES